MFLNSPASRTDSRHSGSVLPIFLKIKMMLRQDPIWFQNCAKEAESFGLRDGMNGCEVATQLARRTRLSTSMGTTAAHIGNEKARQNGFATTVVSPGHIVWFTGLSGAGKSTLAEAVSKRLAAAGQAVELLDGDIVRSHLSKGLGFSPEDRAENVRRIAFVANLLARHGVIVLVPVIAPYRSIREEVRSLSPTYFEVYVNAPLDVCERRDPKGLYRRARAGELAHFTGVDDPYEVPEFPEIECRTDLESVEECASKILQELAAVL
jgi:adenylylsulfate kinase